MEQTQGADGRKRSVVAVRESHDRYRARVKQGLALLDFVGAGCWEDTIRFLKNMAFTDGCPNCAVRAREFLLRWSKSSHYSRAAQARIARGLWESGMSSEAIGREVGVSGTWVRRRAQAGDWSEGADRPRVYWDDEEDRRLLGLVGSGLSLKQAADRLGRSYDGVRYRIRRLRGSQRI